jgi:UDP-N-acetylmuramate--alanine ligase
LTASSHTVFAVITGGGTSGHVIPAMAIAELLQDAGISKDQLHFVGSSTGIETTLVPSSGIPMSLLTVQGFGRVLSFQALKRNIRTIKILQNATRNAERILSSLRPAVVVSVGGYASVPATRAAKKLNIPVVTVSYDRQPGLATRLQARSAAAVAVAYLPSKFKNATLTGAPVRRVLRNLDLSSTRDDARSRLSIPLDRKVICITGGSLGSAKLNSVARILVEKNQNRSDICVIHLTGQRYIGDDLPVLKSDAKIVYVRLESTVAMQDVYSASDLVVARAGASTVAEVSTIGIASVLIPWSGAAENHQTANASWLGDLGGAVVIDENSVANEHLADQVISLIDDRVKIQSLASAARTAGKQHRETTLAKLILNVAGHKERQLIDLRKPKRIHVVGVGGPGMSAIATVLAEMGHQVSGSDIRQSAVITRLENLGIKVNIGHDPEVVFGCDFVTGSPAIAESNIEYKRARESNIRVLSRAETLASICECATSIGVAGTHGKTTTSSMLTTILLSANKNPNYLIGGDVIALNRGASWSNSELFVVEADESDGTHSQLPLAATIVTNIDIDHLDHFKTQSAIERSFFDYVGGIAGPRVLCLDDPVCASISKTHIATTYSVEEKSSADYVASSIKFKDGKSSFMVTQNHNNKKIELGRIDLPLRGLHNVSNALAAIAMAMQFGVRFDQAAQALSGFGGVARRFDVRGVDGGATFVDDYAHLPNEISAVLSGVRDESDKWSRVVAVFQPNRFNRMSMISHLYGDSFVAADLVVITDIYPSGTEPIAGVTGQLVVDAILKSKPQSNVVYQPSRKNLVEFLADEIKNGDLCISMGCGDISSLPNEVIALRRGKSN